MPRQKFDDRIRNCIPSRDTERDWGFRHALEAGVLRALRAIPASRDLREGWWNVGDQGNTGSCVGWATADSVLRWHFVKAGRIAQSEQFSPRFIWMASKETDDVSRPTTFIELEGTSLKAALDIARKYGAVLDGVLPFGSGSLFQGDEATFYATAAQRRIASYFNLGRDMQAWRTWLATHGPILTRLDVDRTFMNVRSDGRLGKYLRATVSGGHAVALVGYTPSTFIVRNSWGTSWGAQGFGYASVSYAQAAFTEAYGVVV